ncbi:hypothetical protein HC891_13305 [Candidatus Gracilibacteria bacterium]|nr:hypothetical protein [Candidatus Gracilibacteria bacterium]
MQTANETTLATLSDGTTPIVGSFDTDGTTPLTASVCSAGFRVATDGEVLTITSDCGDDLTIDLASWAKLNALIIDGTIAQVLDVGTRWTGSAVS